MFEWNARSLFLSHIREGEIRSVNFNSNFGLNNSLVFTNWVKKEDVHKMEKNSNRIQIELKLIRHHKKFLHQTEGSSSEWEIRFELLGSFKLREAGVSPLAHERNDEFDWREFTNRCRWRSSI